jgi:hypothetical protein
MPTNLILVAIVAIAVGTALVIVNWKPSPKKPSRQVINIVAVVLLISLQFGTAQYFSSQADKSLATNISADVALIAADLKSNNYIQFLALISHISEQSGKTVAEISDIIRGESVPALNTNEPLPSIEPTPVAPTPELLTWVVKPDTVNTNDDVWCKTFFEYENGIETGFMVVNGYLNADFTGDIVWIYEGKFKRDELTWEVKPNDTTASTFSRTVDANWQPIPGSFDYSVERAYTNGNEVYPYYYYVLAGGVVQPDLTNTDSAPVRISDLVLPNTPKEGPYTANRN